MALKGFLIFEKDFHIHRSGESYSTQDPTESGQDNQGVLGRLQKEPSSSLMSPKNRRTASRRLGVGGTSSRYSRDNAKTQRDLCQKEPGQRTNARTMGSGLSLEAGSQMEVTSRGCCARSVAMRLHTFSLPTLASIWTEQCAVIVVAINPF